MSCLQADIPLGPEALLGFRAGINGGYDDDRRSLLQRILFEPRLPEPKAHIFGKEYSQPMALGQVVIDPLTSGHI
jgi:hypothetical protein